MKGITMIYDLIYLYNNVFKQTKLYQDMEQMVEDSPWHREKSVAIHTDMVFQNYLMLHNPSEFEKVIGGFAAIFHDVGKPHSVQYKHSEARGDYKSFGGHELVSARLWENWAVENWKMLARDFLFTPRDIYRVGWIIEKHLPWAIKKEDKLHNLALTGFELFSDSGPISYTNMILADTYGRISDDYVDKRLKAHAWVDMYDRRVQKVIGAETFRRFRDFEATLYVLIGASGSGKSTFAAELLRKTNTFSLDALRLEWYVPDNLASAEDPYAYAFKKACDDKMFRSRANHRYIEMLREKNDLIVDNVNTSAKRRRWYINEARNRGYKIVGVIFPITLQEVQLRQKTRNDKTVPIEAVGRQYNSLQTPQYGEFDDIKVIDINLPNV